jgi:ribosome-binding factor A
VGEVRVSPDLRIATVYALPLGGAGTAEALAALARNAGALRRALGREMTLRHVPELRFLADTSFDRIEATRRLLADAAVQRDLRAPGEGDAPPGGSAPTEG